MLKVTVVGAESWIVSEEGDAEAGCDFLPVKASHTPIFVCYATKLRALRRGCELSLDASRAVLA